MPSTRPTRASRALPAPSYRIERATLGNGLRAVVAPDTSAPVVAVAVYYDVGIRSEPEGRTGFAHLFEHLMFQGSANVGKVEHFTLIQGAGGTLNGSTHLDYTNYYEVLPANGLELALFLEADRMRAVALSQENLDNQVAVVQEEIRVNVMNRPYGGFPWILLPPVLFTTFPNAHNGYGDFTELQSATLDDARNFFERYYAPGNAVVTVVGDLDPDEALAMIEQHFGDIPGRATPPQPSFAEPAPEREIRAFHDDPVAPQPAVAVGYRIPDPLGPLEEYLPFVLLAEVLTDGEASRLERRLVRADRLVTNVSCYLGVMGEPFDVRDPTPLIVEATFPDTTPPDRVLDTLDEELDRLAVDGLEPDELARVQARFAAGHLRALSSVIGRAQAFSVLEQQRDRAELVNELPGMIQEVTPEQVQKAAGSLRPDARAVLELRAGSPS